MELIVTILSINAVLLFSVGVVVWAFVKIHTAKVRDSEIEEELERNVKALSRSVYSLSGKVDSLIIAAKVSEKTADRAFTMASSANVASGILQRALSQRPYPLSKEQQAKDQVARKKLEDLFGNDEIEFLKPLLSDDELELLEEAREKMRRAELNGKVEQ